MQRRTTSTLIVAGLLGLWLSSWPDQSTGASRPPIRRAVYGLPRASASEMLEYQSLPSTGLIPTRWEVTSQLIPTEINGEVVLINRLPATEVLHSLNPVVGEYFDNQRRAVDPTVAYQPEEATRGQLEISSEVANSRVTSLDRLDTVTRGAGRRRSVGRK